MSGFCDFKFRGRNFSTDKYYHLYNRGFLKMKIFKSDGDCFRFIDTMQFYCKIFGVKIFNYSLMANHFHFLVKGGDISKFMQKLQQSYATYFNIKYKRVGAVFGGRFSSVVVDKDGYFRDLKKYIALNPVMMIKISPDGTEINSSVQVRTSTFYE